MDSVFSPPCLYHKKCGGCQLQKLPYPEQLKRKMGRCIALLGQFGHVEPILPMEEPSHYRNKVHAAFALDGKRHVVSGIYQPGSHAIVPVDECMIEDAASDAVIRSIRDHQILAKGLLAFAEEARRKRVIFVHEIRRVGRPAGIDLFSRPVQIPRSVQGSCAEEIVQRKGHMISGISDVGDRHHGHLFLQLHGIHMLQL